MGWRGALRPSGALVSKLVELSRAESSSLEDIILLFYRLSLRSVKIIKNVSAKMIGRFEPLSVARESDNAAQRLFPASSTGTAHVHG
jgi:hypothetical protein